MNAFSTDNIFANNITGTTVNATANFIGDGSLLTNLPIPPLAIKYPVGTIQGFIQTHQYSGASGIMQTNRLVGYYITIEKNISIDTLYVRALTTNATARITYGIYSINSAGYPDAKLFNSTEFTLAVSTLQTQSVSWTLSAGTYFVAFNMNSASGTLVGHTRANAYNTAIGTTDTAASFVGQGYDVARVYSTTLPTTFPAGAISTGTAAFNGLWFKIA